MMERRRILLGLVGAMSISAVGCDNVACRDAEIVDDVEKMVDDIESAVSDLESRIGNFDSENWRDVVPEVRSTAQDVGSAVDELRKHLNYLKSSA